ncbi:tRNA (N6-threonylcarbamoyladenosine(37)-N6)-methyltransferase TrmO [Archaeoglobales archaeon ex4484_92]|nr:MAG: tRNA (N6-threonylcarbamoyladenosine(37)-N6)-methyltransferase TrmO [Archaeoglobales archaeon ex4484_92]
MITYRAIGVIRTPFKEPYGTPIQPSAALGIEGEVIIYPEFSEGLRDLDGFSHIILLYHCHLCKSYKLLVRPFLDRDIHGVFATRAPCRPNPIGLSVVRLLEIKGNKLRISDVDIIDGTPLLDIKPYVPEFDERRVEKLGWLEKGVTYLKKVKDDGRFVR